MRFRVAVSPLPKGGAPSTAGDPGKTWLGGPAVQPVSPQVTSAQAGFLSCVQCRTRGKSAFRAAEGFSVLLFTALRFPALIPASSESQFSCAMLYCFICGFQLSPSCLHPETLLFPACLFFSSSSSSFLQSFRSKGCPLSPAPGAHVLCPSFSHRRHLMSLMSCPGCSPAPAPPPHCSAAPVGATRALLPVHLETRPDPTPNSSAHCVSQGEKVFSV